MDSRSEIHNKSTMKRAVFLSISLLLILFSNLYSSYFSPGNNVNPGDSLTVAATPDLYDLSMKWADEYNRQFPGANIKVINAPKFETKLKALEVAEACTRLAPRNRKRPKT